MASKIWQAKADHPRMIWLVFVREKVAGKRKYEPRLVSILESPIVALLVGSGKDRERLAKKLKVRPRNIEIVSYKPIHQLEANDGTGR